MTKQRKIDRKKPKFNCIIVKGKMQRCLFTLKNGQRSNYCVKCGKIKEV